MKCHLPEISPVNLQLLYNESQRCMPLRDIFQSSFKSLQYVQRSTVIYTMRTHVRWLSSSFTHFNPLWRCTTDLDHWFTLCPTSGAKPFEVEIGHTSITLCTSFAIKAGPNVRPKTKEWNLPRPHAKLKALSKNILLVISNGFASSYSGS